MDLQTILVEGHRGGRLDFENTLGAFRQAISNQLKSIEFDVWLTKDKIPIVIHGSENGEIEYEWEAVGIKKDSKINDLELEQIKSIVLPNNETIPTFEELLEVCANKIRLNIELKDKNIELCQLVLDMLYEKEVTPEMAWFTSFDHNMLKEIKRLDPSFEVGYLYEPTDMMAPEYYSKNGDSWNICINMLSKELVENCHRNGMKVRFSSESYRLSKFNSDLGSAWTLCFYIFWLSNVLWRKSRQG